MTSLLTTVVAALLAAAQVPPLTGEQTLRLETARDGRDHREEAFIALLENVRLWTGELGDAAVRLQPNIEKMLATPDAYRGELVRIIGRVEQRTELGRLYDGVEEWFLRDEEGRPIIVFLVNQPSAEQSWRDGQHVAVFARFYKRIDADDRTGTSRSYAAFVGAYPQQFGSPAPDAIVQVWVLAVPVLILLVAFTLLVLFIRRNRRKRGPLPWAMIDDPPLDEGGDLPDDPAEALAELRRRAET